MLTKNDLNQIGVVIHEEVRPIVQEEIKSAIKPLKEDMSQIRKDMKVIVNFFDKEYLELRKRVERIEEILKISPIN